MFLFSLSSQIRQDDKITQRSDDKSQTAWFPLFLYNFTSSMMWRRSKRQTESVRCEAVCGAPVDLLRFGPYLLGSSIFPKSLSFLQSARSSPITHTRLESDSHHANAILERNTGGVFDGYGKWITEYSNQTLNQQMSSSTPCFSYFFGWFRLLHHLINHPKHSECLWITIRH